MNEYLKKHRHSTLDKVKISGEEALQIARRAATASVWQEGYGLTKKEGAHEAERRKVGELVTVSPNDYGKVPVKGRIVEITRERVCIHPENDPTGEKIDVLMHFPRNGYIIVPVVKAAAL
jgi:hypothetical protein